jgi:hypothetical protein
MLEDSSTKSVQNIKSLKFAIWNLDFHYTFTCCYVHAYCFVLFLYIWFAIELPCSDKLSLVPQPFLLPSIKTF